MDQMVGAAVGLVLAVASWATGQGPLASLVLLLVVTLFLPGALAAVREAAAEGNDELSRLFSGQSWMALAMLVAIGTIWILAVPAGLAGWGPQAGPLVGLAGFAVWSLMVWNLLKWGSAPGWWSSIVGSLVDRIRPAGHGSDSTPE